MSNCVRMEEDSGWSSLVEEAILAQMVAVVLYKY